MHGTRAREGHRNFAIEQFFNEDETECVVHEEYVNSEACTQHFKNMGDTAEKIFATSEVTGEMWGNPSADLRAAVESKGVKLYAPFLSLEK